MSDAGTDGHAPLAGGGSRRQLTVSGLLFLTAAFPFIIPIVPSTDTQPTFTLFVVLFAALAIVASIGRQVEVRRSDVMLAGAIISGGLLWLALSYVANGFEAGQLNRIVAFVMLLIAVCAGLLNRDLFTRDRLILALKVYIFFTFVYFATNAALEGLLIRSRGEEALSKIVSTGRGASTLSPEPSFFAFQIFTLFLGARLTFWREIGRRDKHLIQLLTIGLLVVSFAGYGAVYAAIVIFMSGWRYMLGAALAGILGFAVIASYFDIESLRFIQLFISLASSFSGDELKVVDLSTATRLHSLNAYWQIYMEQPLFGDTFSYFGGGGLVSLLASLGLFAMLLLTLVIVTIVMLRVDWKVKIALVGWFALQFVSGPIGLPLIGLLMGIIIGRSRLGTFIDAIALAHRRAVVRPVVAGAANSRQEPTAP